MVTPVSWPSRRNADFGHLDRRHQRALELLESAFDLPDAGQLEQLVLGGFDLSRSRLVEIRLVGVVDDVLAEIDQLPAQEQVVDRAAVMFGVDDVERIGRQLGQIAHAADLGQSLVLLEIALERRRAGLLAALDQRAGGVVDARVRRLHEMLRQQELADLFIGAIVDQQCAEQRDLQLDVRRWRAKSGVIGGSVGEGCQDCRRCAH